jgi:aldehyde:ferredoxin oxidoreductase
MRSGERAWNLKRAINNRMGLTRANDKLPKAFLSRITKAARQALCPISKPCWQHITKPAVGIGQAASRSQQKLMEMGLDEVVKDLWG